MNAFKKQLQYRPIEPCGVDLGNTVRSFGEFCYLIVYELPVPRVCATSKRRVSFLRMLILGNRIGDIEFEIISALRVSFTDLTIKNSHFEKLSSRPMESNSYMESFRSWRTISASLSSFPSSRYHNLNFEFSFVMSVWTVKESFRTKKLPLCQSWW